MITLSKEKLVRFFHFDLHKNEIFLTHFSESRQVCTIIQEKFDVAKGEGM